MWRLSENSDSVKPIDVDKTSSSKVVYVRKDFEELPTLDMDGEQVGTHWRYMENAIPKESWDAYELQMKNMADIEYLSMMTDVDMED